MKIYTNIIRTAVYLNGDDGTNLSGAKLWKKLKSDWNINIIPVENQQDFKVFFEHLNVKTSDGIAWGVTGDKIIYMFINDSSNPFITRSNAMPLGHELLHAIYQETIGTHHIKRKYNAPEGNAGTKGAAATVIVHDNWYGTKETIRFWTRHGLIWLPITIPYCPIKKAKEIYNI